MTHHLRAEDLSFLDRARLVYVFEAPVAAPREQVFAAISADPSTWSWFPGLARGSYESAPPHGVNSIREVTMGRTTYRETIVAWEPPGLWAYRVDESSVPLADALVEEWAILEDPAVPGTSIVRWTFALDPKPLFNGGRIAASMIMGRLFRKAMANLDHRLRADAASDSPPRQNGRSRAMETSLLMSGIGGQGIQFAAQVLARAAILEGREAQLFGSYGGMMRGGNTETTLVFSDRPIDAPPTLDQARSAIVMHHDYSAAVLSHIAPDAILLVNSSVVSDIHDLAPISAETTVITVAATDLAVDAGSIMLASMVMTGAFATVTGLVPIAALERAVSGALPSYRQQHVEANRVALSIGAEAAPAVRIDVWSRAGSVPA